jgi:hypothetical protein
LLKASNGDEKERTKSDRQTSISDKTSNLLITAASASASHSSNSITATNLLPSKQMFKTITTEATDDNSLLINNKLIEEDVDELKQRKKELIIAKQLQRKQQQELIRLKREEHRARQTEELRLKEEEIAQKKLLEKARKEIIFQAYKEKKKQLEEESQSGMFGPQNGLANSKRYHSTQRLKQSPSTNSFLNKSNMSSNMNQNFLDKFDQASLLSETSAHQQQQNMVKST